MIEVVFLIVLALIWIIFASVQDLREREVANWLNFSLIIFALGFRFFYSLFSESGFMFFYQGLIGLGIFFILGNILYHGRLFAGGDAKLMIALGAVLPFSNEFLVNVNIFVLFFIIFLFAGAFYGLVWSLVLVSRNYGRFKKEFSKRLKKNKKLIYSVMVLGLVLMVVGFIETLILFFGVLLFIFPYFYLYAKSIDEVCMVKKIETNELREGDWLYENVKVGGKIIRANWDGLDEKGISLLKKNKKVVLIREGIPFVPVFLISFLVLLLVWSLGYSLW